MSNLLRKVMGKPGTPLAQKLGSARFTGIGYRSNPATGDRGPDAPGTGPGRRDPDRPRPRNRRLGGDVRTPLS